MKHRIIVLGAGYTGASAAGRLAKRLRREDVAITLVNAEPDFVERVRMHQLAVGQDLRTRPFSEMFADTGVELKLAKVTGVDVDSRTVTVDGANGAQELAYDTLVYALGSGWNTQGVPGISEHAHEITETRPDLDVALAVRGGLGDWLSPKGRAHVRMVCARLGVTVHENTSVTGVAAGHVTTADGTSLPAAVTVWTTGFAVHPIARATTLEVDSTACAAVHGTVRPVSGYDLDAIGDALMGMRPGDKPLRMSCASGTPTAWQV